MNLYTGAYFILSDFRDTQGTVMQKGSDSDDLKSKKIDKDSELWFVVQTNSDFDQADKDPRASEGKAKME